MSKCLHCCCCSLQLMGMNVTQLVSTFRAPHGEITVSKYTVMLNPSPPSWCLHAFVCSQRPRQRVMALAWACPDVCVAAPTVSLLSHSPYGMRAPRRTVMHGVCRMLQLSPSTAATSPSTASSHFHVPCVMPPVTRRHNQVEFVSPECSHGSHG